MCGHFCVPREAANVCHPGAYFFLFFFAVCMHVIYGSFLCKTQYFSIAVKFSILNWFRNLFFSGFLPYFDSDQVTCWRQSLNFEQISIEVFINRVNHTRKRWAVNNNFHCLLIELQGVSKTDIFLVLTSFQLFRSDFAFLCKRCKRYFYEEKFSIFI